MPGQNPQSAQNGLRVHAGGIGGSAQPLAHHACAGRGHGLAACGAAAGIVLSVVGRAEAKCMQLVGVCVYVECLVYLCYLLEVHSYASPVRCQ